MGFKIKYLLWVCDSEVTGSGKQWWWKSAVFCQKFDSEKFKQIYQSSFCTKHFAVEICLI